MYANYKVQTMTFATNADNKFLSFMIMIQANQFYKQKKNHLLYFKFIQSFRYLRNQKLFLQKNYCLILYFLILHLKLLVNNTYQSQESGNMENKQYRVIGMMSGTSLDGIDLAFCNFIYDNQWKYTLLASKTYPYTKKILQLIFQMEQESTTFLQFKKAQIKYSLFLAQTISAFMQQNFIQNVDFVSIHGHTIFHQPSQKITVQAGNLTTIAAQLGISVIGNFRQYDVMKGGQGAPLVPYGEELFGSNIFLNLGGVSNIGYKRQGWDINYCNLFSNYFAFSINGSQFDLDGQLGRKGKICNNIKKYIQKHYRNIERLSLGREGFQKMVQDLNQNFPQTAKEDILHTFYHFLSQQISRNIEQLLGQRGQNQIYEIFCTGGGTKNKYLFELLSQKSIKAIRYVKPSEGIVDFKEAIIFAFLGVKFIIESQNCSKGIGGMQVKVRRM